MAFVHLHNHTEFSLLDGMCRIKDLIAKAKEHKMPAVAITDHGALYGAFKFYLACKEADIKPIIGCELYKAKGKRSEMTATGEKNTFHLLTIAKNYTGYQNLIKLVSLANLDGFYYKPRVDWELLEKYHEGLIATTSCLAGEVPQLILQNQIKQAEKIIQKYQTIFGADFYIELQRHPNMDELDQVNKVLIEFSRKFNIPLLATNDVHYLEKEDAYAQEILLCIQTQRSIVEKNRPMTMYETPDYYFKSPDEMEKLFYDFPEAIENAGKIADECNLEIPYGKLILPKFATPKNHTSETYLKKLVNDRKSRIKGANEKVINDRLEYELNIINNKGYAPYFLFVQDIVNWAKDHGIAVGPGRGSAAGSLVAYALKITDVDPLEYKIPFERFLNPGRPTPPDIDIDFSDKRRDEVISYISRKYGADHVAQVITFGTMEAKMAVRDVARALGYSYSQGDRISKMIPPGKQGFKVSLSTALDESANLKLAYTSEPEVKKVIDIAKKVESLPRHFSVHAAAVVIADKPLIEYVPIQKDNKEGKIITQYDMYCLDLNAVADNKAVGLVKADILGLRNLSILEEALAFVKDFTGKTIDIHEVPLDDAKTYELMSRGETIGVFQLESSGMRRLAKDLKPNKFTDITAMVALYRPGPMDLIPQFVASKNSAKKIHYPHKNLEPILEESYGVIVYQEQCMEIANKIAGFTMVEADFLRMAMGKKKKKMMKEGKEKFIAGAVQNGYTKKFAVELFSKIETFSAYGFNKPHSVSYALIAYWTAYMKANFPIEYMTALMTAELEGSAGPLKEFKMSQAIEESKRMKISVIPPDINKSVFKFSIEDRAIRIGLSAIKNVGLSAIDSIIESREKDGNFASFSEFLYRVDLRKVNKKTVESLIKSGAFDQFANKATLLSAYPQLVATISKSKEKNDEGQSGLFGQHDKSRYTKDNFPILPEISDNQLIAFEKEVIGFIISRNPMDRHQEIIKKKVNKHFMEISENDIDRSYIFAAQISNKKVVKTKKNNVEMAFLQLNDSTGSIEAIVFPKLYANIKDMLELNTVLLFQGKVSEREGEHSLLVDKVVNLDHRASQLAK